MADDSRQRTHPDAVAIELLRAGEGTAEDQAHVAACSECSRALAGLVDLAAELRRYGSTAVEIPEEVDARVLWNARKRAAEIRRPNTTRWRAVGAIAATVLLSLAAVAVWQRSAIIPGSRTAVADIDGDGRIDIVDALRLARAVERGAHLDRSWDVNGDGVVDQRDADAVAVRAVAIGGA